MTRGDQFHDQGVVKVEGDEIIEVVYDTVRQLELLTERLRSFMDNMEDP